MLLTDLATAQIPDIYKRFADVVGDCHWKKRAASLKQNIKRNPLLREYLQAENTIALQLEHLRQLTEKYGGIPQDQTQDRDIYPAASFATQILSIMDTVTAKQATGLARRIHGAVKNPEDMRAMRLELTAATHFARRGYKIAWPERTDEGTFDLLIKDVGVNGLEVECKSISEDKGRKVHRYDALEFYHLAWPCFKGIRNGLKTGVSAVLTVPDRLPNQHKDRLALAKQLGTQIGLIQSTSLADGAEIKITEFDPASLGYNPTTSTRHQMRTALNDVTDTKNRSSLVIGTAAGGVLVLTVQSKADDSYLNAVFDTLSTSAKKQLTGKRAAIFMVGLDGLDGAQLLSIATQGQDPIQPPTGLQLATSKFLAKQNRDNLVGIGFVSSSSLIPVSDGVQESGGTAYYFPKKESPFWHADFSGMFSASK